jgi:hypothetical protein
MAKKMPTAFQANAARIAAGRKPVKGAKGARLTQSEQNQVLDAELQRRKPRLPNPAKHAK